MVCCLTPDRGCQNIELLEVCLKRVGVEFGQFPGGHACSFCPQLHLVFAGISIGCKVADISDVDDMVDFITVCDKNAYQKVLKQVSAQVPDMSKVVDSWSAGIDANLVIYKRFKRANFTFVGIK